MGTDSEWDDLIGPFCTVASLATYLGVAPLQLHDLHRQGRLLATRTEDGTALYPSFQIGPDKTLLPHLPSLLETLSRCIDDPWTIALWLKTPRPELEGRAPHEMLRGESKEAKHVLDLASEDVARRTAP